MRRGAARVARAVFAMTVAGSVVACGVGSDPAAREVSPDDVPYALMEAAPSTTTTTAPPVAPKVQVTVYLVLGAQVQPVAREVVEPATVSKALAALVAGPAEDEAAAGVRTAINPSAGVAPRGLDDEIVTVDLTGEFALAPSAEQVLGLAQIVFTATEIPGVSAVRFTLEGEAIEVPTPSGSLVPGPVNREAFAALASPG